LSNFKLAINSIDEKKMERLNNTLKSYRTFASLFPDSNKLDELNGIKKQTEKAIEEFKEIN
jgi:outer membrane protein assembly factor BamD